MVFVRGKKQGIEFSRLVYKKVLGFLNRINDKVQKLPQIDNIFAGFKYLSKSVKRLGRIL